MLYDYTLCKEDQRKYGFSNLVCNGWQGIHDDKFNDKWKPREDKNGYSRINIDLSESDIDRITANALKIVEY